MATVQSPLSCGTRRVKSSQGTSALTSGRSMSARASSGAAGWIVARNAATKGQRAARRFSSTATARSFAASRAAKRFSSAATVRSFAA